MANSRIVLLTLLALLAFAGNSLLCRAALAHSSINAASFTTIRLLSGAITLWCLLAVQQKASSAKLTGAGDWRSALAILGGIALVVLKPRSKG